MFHRNDGRHQAILMATYLQGHGFEHLKGKWNTRWALAQVIASQSMSPEDQHMDLVQMLDSGLIVPTEHTTGFIVATKPMEIIQKHMDTAFREVHGEI